MYTAYMQALKEELDYRLQEFGPCKCSLTRNDAVLEGPTYRFSYIPGQPLRRPARAGPPANWTSVACPIIIALRQNDYKRAQNQRRRPGPVSGRMKEPISIEELTMVM